MAESAEKKRRRGRDKYSFASDLVRWIAMIRRSLPAPPQALRERKAPRFELGLPMKARELLSPSSSPPSINEPNTHETDESG